METKTCGECRWFDSAFCLCCRSIERFGEAYSDNKACEDFEEINYSEESEVDDEETAIFQAEEKGKVE